MDNLEPITRNEMFLNGDDLEPITREEMILAGADLEPLTRHEWFLKKYRGGGGGGGYDLVNIPNLPADIASFNDGTDLPMASLKVAVTPYQDLSHGDPSPDNICPISGWDEAVVTVADDAESPTTSHEYTIDLDGTRYGGTLDVLSGVLTVDREIVTFDGSSDEEWEFDADLTSSDGFVCFRAYLRNNNIKKPEGTAVTISYIGKMFSSTMPTLKNGYANQYPMANTVMGITGYSGTGNNYFYLNINKTLSNIQSVADLRAWLAENPTTVCYELATPISVQLSPTLIKSLEGTNNIFANCGQITEVKYFKKA